MIPADSSSNLMKEKHFLKFREISDQKIKFLSNKRTTSTLSFLISAETLKLQLPCICLSLSTCGLVALQQFELWRLNIPFLISFAPYFQIDMCLPEI